MLVISLPFVKQSVGPSLTWARRILVRWNKRSLHVKDAMYLEEVFLMLFSLQFDCYVFAHFFILI